MNNENDDSCGKRKKKKDMKAYQSIDLAEQSEVVAPGQQFRQVADANSTIFTNGGI